MVTLTRPELIMVEQGQPIDLVKKEWGPEILDYPFPEPKWVVPGFIPEGLTILAGRPKSCKSWLMLQMLKEVGIGGTLFGNQIEKRKCLYLALEDSARRLQRRLNIQGWPSNFSVIFRTDLPKPLDKGGIEWLLKEIDIHGYGVVGIDTYSRAISKRLDQNKGGSVTEVNGKLQEASWTKDCPIILVDHFKKPGVRNADDVIDEVSGSTGKTGTADTVIGVFKKRGETTGQFRVTGRDVEEMDVTMEFMGQTCTWRMVGETGNIVSNVSEKRLLDAIEEMGNDATSVNLESELGWSKGQISKLVNRLAEKEAILKGGKGKPHQKIDSVVSMWDNNIFT